MIGAWESYLNGPPERAIPTSPQSPAVAFANYTKR
jgi:hypothetical protein